MGWGKITKGKDYCSSYDNFAEIPYGQIPKTPNKENKLWMGTICAICLLVDGCAIVPIEKNFGKQ